MLNKQTKWEEIIMNNNIKKLLLFGVVLILTLGIVCATNTTDTVTEHKIIKNTQEHNTAIIIKDKVTSTKVMTKNTNKTTKKAAANTYTTTANNYNELVNKVNHAKTTTYETYTINLKKGTYTATTFIDWYDARENQQLIINGNQATIKGQNTKLMSIGARCKVKLNNIKIENFNSGDGGAIYNMGLLTINNTQFTNNTAEYDGGAIYDRGSLTINNTQFRNNNAGVNGGAIRSYAGTITITNTEFTNNTHMAIYLYAVSLTVNNTKFTNNTNGAILSTSGISTVSNTDFTNNTRAIFTDGGTFTVTNSQFTNNNASYESLYIGDGILNSKNNNFTGKYSDEIRLNGGNLTIKNNYFNKKRITKYTTSKLPITLSVYPSNINYGGTILIFGNMGNGNIAPSEALIKINNQTHLVKIQDYGYYELNYKANKTGKNTVTVTYNKTKGYDSNTVKAEFYVKKQVNILLYKIPVATKGKVSKISGKLLSNNKGIKGANVTININGKKYTAKTNSSGYFTVNYKVPTFNQRTVKASYGGSSVYSQASNKTTFNVRQKTKINILTKGNVQKGKSVKISGVLRLTKNNAGVKKQVVTVIVGSKKYTTKTYSSGYFAVNHKFDGSKTKVPLKFIFDGSTNYLESNATATLKII